MKTENTEKRGSGVIIWGVAILSILLGVGIFLYPFISNFFAELSQNKVIDIYKANVEDTSKEEIEAEWEEAKIYNENLSGDPVHDSFIVGSGYAVPDNYDEVLNLDEEGVMCYLEIPKLDLHLPVYHGTSEEVLRKGVGHLEMTALPIGGKNRRTVLTGHRGLPRAELFTRLDEMKLGDEIYIHILDETHAYKVKEIKTVEPEELQNLTITPDTIAHMVAPPHAFPIPRITLETMIIASEPPEKFSTSIPIMSNTRPIANTFLFPNRFTSIAIRNIPQICTILKIPLIVPTRFLSPKISFA